MRKAGWNQRNERKIKSLALKKTMKFTNIFFNQFDSVAFTIFEKYFVYMSLQTM